VSMAGFFAGVSNTPIATIIFISELTGSYELLIPSLLVCSLTYILMHKWTIYSRQVANKFSSPAHKGELFLDIMQEYKVKELINEFKKPIIVSPRMTLQKFKTLICKTKRNYFCLVENNTL
ncbi:MAG TPA: chloride channel protein, partial [Desulfonauticus sp.]|nr:chloride channel protein [Desulfonauticus sp.]